MAGGEREKWGRVWVAFLSGKDNHESKWQKEREAWRTQSVCGPHLDTGDGSQWIFINVNNHSASASPHPECLRQAQALRPSSPSSFYMKIQPQSSVNLICAIATPAFTLRWISCGNPPPHRQAATVHQLFSSVHRAVLEICTVIMQTFHPNCCRGKMEEASSWGPR